MLRFKHFLIEKLTSDQEREVSNWRRDPEAIKHTDHYFGVGNDEINEPLSGGHSEKSEPHKAVERHLGQEIDIDSYKKGLTKDQYGRDVKIGSLLSKSKAPQKLINDFANDSTRQLKKAEGLTVRVTRSPAGVAGQTSRGQSWENQSCKNYETGSNKDFLKDEVKHGSVVAYLMHPNGTELARATLHPHYNDEGHVAYDMNSYYGVEHNDFMNHVHDLSTKLSQEHKGGSILYDIHPDVYNDRSTQRMLHPTTSSETIDGLLDHRDSVIRKDVVRSRLLSSTQISKALQDKEQGVRASAIRNENANEEHISQALDDKSNRVRASAIRNENANADHITKALDDTDEYVRVFALEHKKVNIGHITKALDDEDPDIRRLAISHPKVNADHITKALNDKDYNVRMSAISIQHQKLNADHLSQALDDESPKLRLRVMLNPKIDETHITKALQDSDKYVRESAIYHPKATVEHLKYAVDNDTHKNNVYAARHTLKTKHNIDY